MLLTDLASADRAEGLDLIEFSGCYDEEASATARQAAEPGTDVVVLTDGSAFTYREATGWRLVPED